MFNSRQYREIPEPAKGVFDVPGSWSVLRPTTTTRFNLALNPSAELSATAEWFDGGTFPSFCELPTRSAAEAWIGEASFSMELTGANSDIQSGFYFSPPALGRYTVSLYVKKTGNLDNFAINVDGIENPQSILSRTYDHSDGTESDWFRCAYSFDVVSLSDKLIRFRGEPYTFGEYFTLYLDGILVEQTNKVLPYFDGSLEGARWQGLAHRSISVLDEGEAALSDFGFQMTDMVGGNAVQWNTISTPLAFGGGYYQRSTAAMSELTLVGAIEASGRPDLERKRRGLQNLLSPQSNIPLRMIYRPQEMCGAEDWAQSVMVEAVYTGGLEGNLTNEFVERVSINFRIHTPYIATDLIDQTQNITILKAIDARPGFIRRDSFGVYHAMPYITAQELTIYARSPWGVIYAAYSVDPTDLRLYTLDEENMTYSQVGAFTATAITPDPLRINSIRFDRSGNVWVCGNFNTVDGNTANNLAVYANGSWSSPITTITEAYSLGLATVQDVAWTSEGTMYVVGNFATINGVTIKNFGKFEGGVFVAVSPGINGSFDDTLPPTLHLLVDARDTVYIYGRFSGSGGSLTPRNYWTYTPSDGSFRSPGNVGDVDSEEVFKALFLRDGSLIMLGTFTAVKGTPLNGYVIWQGDNYQSIPYLEPYFPPSSVSQGPDGLLQMGYPLPDPYTGGWLQFNGDVLIRPEYRPGEDAFEDGVSFGAFTTVDAYPDRMTYLFGVASQATAYVPETNVITVDGDANVWPEFFLIGPLNLYNITNHTTGKTMHFNLVLQAGDTARLKLFPRVELNAVMGGNLKASVLAGSQTREFFLVPGDNYLNFGADPYGNSDTLIIATWRNTYNSLGAAFD